MAKDTPQVTQADDHPKGLLPKHLQTWIILGVAVLMLLVLLFDTPAPVRRPSGQGGSSAESARRAAPPSGEQVSRYQRELQESARRLTEQLQRERGRQAAAQEPLVGGPPDLRGSAYPPPAYPGASAPVRKNELRRAQREREFSSRFASNIALTRRPADQAGNRPPEASPSSAVPEVSASLESSGRTPEESRPAGFSLLEGTVLEAVLVNRLDGSFSGPVDCMITTPVYSADRQILLIPRGSRVLGRTSQVEAFGQERLAVAFHRLILPNGTSYSLEQTPGLNQRGETGLRDRVNRHFFRIFGASLAVGALAGFSQAGTRFSDNTSSLDAYRQGVSSSVSQSSIRILDRFLNQLPTLTIREGHRVKIYLTSDLRLPPYQGEIR